MRRTAGLATAVVVSGGLGLAALGLAAGAANAGPTSVPQYHWCPGDYWDPGWGYNWYYGGCHDDHHMDAWGADYSHDWWGGPPPPPPPVPWGPPPPPWAPWGPWGGPPPPP
jgi:hypothetical protein